MPSKTEVMLTKMSSGQSGMITDVQGGPGLMNRLAALGVIKGKKISKVSDMIMRGPVIVKVGQTRIAIGHGMAGKVMVEIDTP